MPITKANHRFFHRTLYAGELQKLILYKRDDDQRQGVVRTIPLWECRRQAIHKAGNTLQNDLTSNQRTSWRIPASQLEKAGVFYLSPADQFYDPLERGTWQPEATTQIVIKLLGDWFGVDCLKTDPVR